MTIIRQLLIASCVLTASLTQAVSMKNFDRSTLAPYVNMSQAALTAVADQVQFEDHGPREIMVAGQSIADALYPRQKAALKVILKKLQYNAKNEKGTNVKTARQLYKAFKNDVYRNWKTTFKNNYKQSRKSNDLFSWGWSIQLQSIAINE